MAADDLGTLTAALAWHRAGHRVAIATVTDTWGSAPRRKGSHLAIRDDGLFEGSVSGGCVEGDVITEAQALLAAGTGVATLDYGVADATAWQVGLACGGRIQVLVQRLADDGFAPALVERLAAAAETGEAVTLATDPATGLTHEGEAAPLTRAYPPPRRLAIIGAVHIAQALVPLAIGLGVTPSVIDPRGLFAADARFAGLELDRRWPDEALTEWKPNAASAIVALTHDPKLDDVALAAALRSPAYYVAALGSRKNHAGRLERLAALGFDADTLARVKGPAGLAIGAADPAEIALSIAAEMTAAWRGAPIAARGALAPPRMIFGAVPTLDAEGAILAHSLLVGGQRWPKGRILTAADIATATAAGIDRLTIARLAATDIGEDAAAAALAAALAATLTDTGLMALPAAHGRANIAAGGAGIVTIDPAMVAAINAIDEALTLATLAPNTRVTAGEIIATVKVIRYAVGAEALAAATAAAIPFRLAPFRPLAIALIATSLDGPGNAKALAKTARVTRDRAEALGCTLTELPPCRHDETALAAALANAKAADIILVIGASATVDRGDVIPAAITAAGGLVERLGMPVDPGNLLCLGHIGGRPVIGLPGCARSPKRNGFDIVLERLVAGLAVTSHDIAMLGAGGLLPEAERPEPRAVSATAPASPAVTGAIILAAGRSSRMGGDHKLLADWRGRPLVAHVADAIAAAGLPAPIVVLGARAADVRAALGDRPAQYVIAADHADGLSRSLRAGIAAVPPDWTAALVCLGDMPRIEPALLAALAAAPGDVALPVWDGKRGNPVRWHRRHFARLMALDGDVGGKAVLADALAITEVPAPSDAVLDDIDTPSALAALRERL